MSVRVVLSLPHVFVKFLGQLERARRIRRRKMVILGRGIEETESVRAPALSIESGKNI